jgi:hypothetical protein
MVVFAAPVGTAQVGSVMAIGVRPGVQTSQVLAESNVDSAGVGQGQFNGALAESDVDSAGTAARPSGSADEDIRGINSDAATSLWRKLANFMYIGPQQRSNPDGGGPGCQTYPLDPKCQTQPTGDAFIFAGKQLEVSPVKPKQTTMAGGTRPLVETRDPLDINIDGVGGIRMYAAGGSGKSTASVTTRLWRKLGSFMHFPSFNANPDDEVDCMMVKCEKALGVSYNPPKVIKVNLFGGPGPLVPDRDGGGHSHILVYHGR